MVIDAFDNALIQNIKFEKIYIVKDILCKDIYVSIEASTFPSIIFGKTRECCFNGIIVENLVFLYGMDDNSIILNTIDGDFQVNEYVYNLVFKKAGLLTN